MPGLPDRFRRPWNVYTCLCVSVSECMCVCKKQSTYSLAAEYQSLAPGKLGPLRTKQALQAMQVMPACIGGSVSNSATFHAHRC